MRADLQSTVFSEVKGVTSQGAIAKAFLASFFVRCLCLNIFIRSQFCVTVSGPVHRLRYVLVAITKLHSNDEQYCSLKCGIFVLA